MRRTEVMFIGLVSLAATTAAGVAHAKSDRYLAFISDSHLGIGHAPAPNGGVGGAPGARWDNYEDARWPEDLKAFLEDLQAIGNGRVDLVLNGDTFELWQSRDVPCIYEDANLGCSEADAARRMKRIVAQHAAELQALLGFSRQGDNRVFIVIGNHDVALVLPAVERELRAALGPDSGRITVIKGGSWRSADGLVVAEHGQQIPADPNAFRGWPTPTVTHGGQLHVVRPWGEQFVQQFYNQYEDKYPVIDNLTSEAEGVRLGLRLERTKGAVRGVGAFLKFILFDESWTQFVSALSGKGKAPRWDIETERAKGHIFLLQSLLPDDPARMAITNETIADLDAYVSDPVQLTDPDIYEICNRRFAAARAGQAIRTCEQSGLSGGGGDTLGAVAFTLTHNRERVLRRYVDALGAPKVFVFSHTHKAEVVPLSDSPTLVLNTGAWQRLISRRRLDETAKQRHETAEALFSRLTPSELDACYSFVAVPPYVSDPRASLMSWRLDPATHKWSRSSQRCE